jgi:hypothetical protein
LEIEHVEGLSMTLKKNVTNLLALGCLVSENIVLIYDMPILLYPLPVAELDNQGGADIYF